MTLKKLTRQPDQGYRRIVVGRMTRPKSTAIERKVPPERMFRNPIMIRIVLGLLAAAVVIAGGCTSRPPDMKPGDNFCMNTVGLGGRVRFFIVRSMKYPWVEASPNPDCEGARSSRTYWINLESVGDFSPNCVCEK